MSENTLTGSRRILDLSKSASLGEEVARSRRELLAPGTNLRGGRYCIRRLVGNGGEGAVYRSMDRLRGREVALKILHFDDNSSIPRLKQEFRFLRDLIHPRLVQLYELDIRPELSFFTMSFVEGKDFLKSIQSESDARKYFVQLAEVVSFLHRTGRIHRDIKANNILIRANGELVLLDFGIGENLSGRGDPEGTLMGTPRYMAPEVLRLEPASRMSDAYSMGVLLYEALVGEPPSPADRANLFQKECFDPGDRRSELPEDLRQVVCRLTHPVLAERGTVEEALLLLSSEEESRSGGRKRLGSTFPSPEAAGPYVGRRQELDRLGEAFRRVVEDGETVLVQIEARSGMGKSSLLAQFLASQDAALVFRSRCSEDELVSHNAIDGVLEDLISFLLDQETPAVLALLPLGDASLLLQLFPELGGVPAFSSLEPESLQGGDYRAVRHRTYLALASVFARIAKTRPLIIAIDDLQWGDLDSGKLLYEIFSAHDRPTCLLLLAYRSEEKRSSPCLEHLFYQAAPLADQLLSSRFELAPLVERDARSLLVDLLGAEGVSSEVLEGLIAEAAGSPLLLTELASYLKERPSEAQMAKTKGGHIGLDRIVRSRFLGLSESGRLCFSLLCCSGAALDVGFLASLSQGDPETISLELESSRLARGREGRTFLTTLHDAIRQAHLRQLGPEEKDLHLILAQGLLDRNGDAAEVARHFHAAGDPRASEWAADAALAASLSFALSQAVEFYRLALLGDELSDAKRRQLRERLADALADSGCGAEAAPLYAELAESASVDKAIEFRRRAAEQWLIIGDATQGTAVLQQVQKEVGLKWPKSAVAAFQSLLYYRFRLKFEAKIEARDEEAGSSAESDTAIERKLAACRAAWPVSFMSVIHGAANSSRYVHLALQTRERRHMGIGFAMEAMYQASAGISERGRTESLLKRAKELSAEGASDYTKAFLTFSKGQCEYLLGDMSESLRYYSDAEVRFLRYCRNVSWELNSGRIFWADALLYLGRHQEFDRRMTEWLGDARERGDCYLGSALLLSGAPRTAMRGGDITQAASEIEEGAAAWKSPYVGYHMISEAVVRAQLSIYAGEPAHAVDAFVGVKGALRRSFLDQVQVARIQTSEIKAVALVECAVDTQSTRERSRLLNRARSLARRLHRERAPHTIAFASMIESTASLIERPTENALESLIEAGRSFTSCDMVHHAAAVDARVGEIIGGDKGRELQESARRVFSQSEFADWVRALRCYVPRILVA